MIIVLTQIIDAYQVTNDANGERLVRQKEMAYYTGEQYAVWSVIV